MGYLTGKTIKELREKRKLTQKELAEIINVSDKTISKWETEKGLPDIAIIEDLAKALGTSSEDFPVLSPVIPPHKVLISNLHDCQAMVDRRIYFLRLLPRNINYFQQFISFCVLYKYV